MTLIIVKMFYLEKIISYPASLEQKFHMFYGYELNSWIFFLSVHTLPILQVGNTLIHINQGINNVGWIHSSVKDNL